MTEQYSVFIVLYIGSVEGDTYIQIDTYSTHIVKENIYSNPERILGMVMYKCRYSKKRTFKLIERVINEIYSVRDEVYGYKHNPIYPSAREYSIYLTQEDDEINPTDVYKEYLYEAIKINAPFKFNVSGSYIDGIIAFKLKKNVIGKYIILVYYHNMEF